MAVLSADLAHKRYADIGAVLLEQREDRIRCDLLCIPLTGKPSSEPLAKFLNDKCAGAGIRILLLDGPQGWKAQDNGLVHSRCCERELNTPAKTGLPGSVKPKSYCDFVVFSIAVFDALARLGWERFRWIPSVLGSTGRVVIESYPRSAWKALGIVPLPAKKRAKAADIDRCHSDLKALVPLDMSGRPNHDQLQAIVAGIAGLAFERNDWDGVCAAGIVPSLEDQHWREGFILNPVRPRSGGAAP